MPAKNLLPLPLRNRLRPAYQRTVKFMRDRQQAIVESSVWPKPAPWHQTKNKIQDITDTQSLYHIAQEEFGIQQVENEIVPFLDYVADHHPRVIGEIGLRHGGNSFLFLRRLSEVDFYCGMDLILQNTGKMRFLRRPQQQLHIFEGNSQLPVMVDKARKRLSGRRFDFLFIDGDHEYDGVLEDLVQWYSLVKPGGLIAFHDIVPDEEAKTGVRPADSKIWGGGVYKLWANIKPHFEHKEFVNDWDQGGFGIGVITKPDDQPLADDLVTQWREQGIGRVSGSQC